jgi:ABC-type multidrug transport system permease subunit
MNGRVVGALVRRALNEITRVPGAALPGVLAPTIFMCGLTAVFSAAATLPGYDAPNFISFILPVSLLQGAGFTGAATGVNLARDIEQGWFDRMVVAPVPRVVLLAGVVLSAAFRALLPASVIVIVGLILGAHWPGVGPLVLDLVLVAGLACSMACWGVMLALRFKTQQAAPLMQVGSFIAVLFTAAYAPMALLSGWMHAIATVNPVNYVLGAARQGFVYDPSWSHTWPGLLALAGLLLVLGGLAVRGLRRVGV